jgi:hypothetical protein
LEAVVPFEAYGVENTYRYKRNAEGKGMEILEIDYKVILPQYILVAGVATSPLWKTLLN